MAASRRWRESLECDARHALIPCSQQPRNLLRRQHPPGAHHLIIEGQAGRGHDASFGDGGHVGDFYDFVAAAELGDGGLGVFGQRHAALAARAEDLDLHVNSPWVG